MWIRNQGVRPMAAEGNYVTGNEVIGKTLYVGDVYGIC